MLIGEYRTKIGEKNRISLPKKFRDELGENLILTRGYEEALILVNQDMWSKVAQEVVNGSFINKNIRDTSRFLVGGAKEIVTDSQGRFILPETLIEYGQLETEIVFIGLINWIEIWNKDKWEKRLEFLKENGEQIAQELSKMKDIQNG